MKSRIASFLSKVEGSLGVPRPAVVVLNYKDPHINNFVEQVNLLEELGYKFITASQVCEFVSGSRKINEKSLCLNFDATKSEILPFAVALLGSRNIPATVFANQYTDLKLIPDNWEIGAVGITKKETIELKDYLEERSGKKVQTLATGFSRYDLYASKMAKKAGFIGAFGYKLGLPKKNKFIISQIVVKKPHNKAHFDSFLRNWTSVYWLFRNIFVKSDFGQVQTTQLRPGLT